jgi:antitoxin component of RelBE/YafQ-DinJ toxin-antitoxin module
MPRTATIQARIDPEIKAKAQKILNKLHISMSEAISCQGPSQFPT